MENSVNNCVRQRVFSNHQVRTIQEEEDQKEESSWLVYFEDIDHEDEMVEEMSHNYDNDSSMISDAASPVYNTKINNNVARRKANSITTNPKKRRIIHQQEEGDEDEEEDTASSPSNKTKGLIFKKHCVARDTGSNINELINEEFLSAELKKRGLCLVPLSMFSNFIA